MANIALLFLQAPREKIISKASKNFIGIGSLFRYMHLYARDTHLKQVASLGQAALFKANIVPENVGKIHALINKAHDRKQQIQPAVVYESFLAQFDCKTKIEVTIEPKHKNATFTITTMDQQRKERTARVTLTSQDKKNTNIIDLDEYNKPPERDSFNISEQDSLAKITYLFLTSLLHSSSLTQSLTLTQQCQGSNLHAKRYGFTNDSPENNNYNTVSVVAGKPISDAGGYRLIKDVIKKTLSKYDSHFPQLTLDHFSYGKHKQD
jgi:hypothetical protein